MKLNNQEKETGILSEYEKTIFCRNKLNLLGEWGFMQITVMSEGLLLNSKYIKMGREEGVFKLSSHNHLL